MQLCMVPGNALVIAEDLWLLFNQNLVGIDVDVRPSNVLDILILPNVFYQDHYRIVCFVKRDDIKWRLRTHLHEYIRRYLNDRFLRRHFAQCLASSTCCGVSPSDDSDEQDDDPMDEIVTDVDDSGDLSADDRS